MRWSQLTASLGPEPIPQTNPDAARRANRAKLFGHRIDSGRGTETSPRSGEKVLAEHGEVVIALVEQIRNERKDRKSRHRLVMRIEVDDRVARNLAVPIDVVLVAVGILR